MGAMDMTPDDIYKELGKFITLLKSDGNDQLAKILEHRMYKVSWTSSTELLECIASILTDYVGDDAKALNSDTVEKAKVIIKEIESTVRD